MDHPLDLAPAAEMEDVAERAAAVGPRRRLARGMGAEARDQLRRVGRRRAVGKVDALHDVPALIFSFDRPSLAGARFEIGDGHAQRGVNQMALAAKACHCRPMAVPDRVPRGGGVLLALSLIAGVAAGTLAGQPSLGFLAGLAVGLALVLAIWLADRRRP